LILKELRNLLLSFLCIISTTLPNLSIPDTHALSSAKGNSQQQLLHEKEKTTQAVKATPHINKEKEPLWHRVP
jgi:hypothetical protein